MIVRNNLGLLIDLDQRHHSVDDQVAELQIIKSQLENLFPVNEFKIGLYLGSVGLILGESKYSHILKNTGAGDCVFKASGAGLVVIGDVCEDEAHDSVLRREASNLLLTDPSATVEEKQFIREISHAEEDNINDVCNPGHYNSLFIDCIGKTLKKLDVFKNFNIIVYEMRSNWKQSPLMSGATHNQIGFDAAIAEANRENVLALALTQELVHVETLIPDNKVESVRRWLTSSQYGAQFELETLDAWSHTLQDRIDEHRGVDRNTLLLAQKFALENASYQGARQRSHRQRKQTEFLMYDN